MFCKHHGELKAENISITNYKRKGISLKRKRCRLCHNNESKNEERRAINRKRKLEYYHKNKWKFTSGQIARNVKMDKTEYCLLLEKANNLCALCGKVETRKTRSPGEVSRLCIDHCHVCWDNGYRGMDVIRGLLCHLCNSALGKFKDNPELLRKAADYLEKHKHK